MAKSLDISKFIKVDYKYARLFFSLKVPIYYDFSYKLVFRFPTVKVYYSGRCRGQLFLVNKDYYLLLHYLFNHVIYQGYSLTSLLDIRFDNLTPRQRDYLQTNFNKFLLAENQDEFDKLILRAKMSII